MILALQTSVESNSYSLTLGEQQTKRKAMKISKVLRTLSLSVLLLASLTTNAMVVCITNLAIVTQNGANFTVNGQPSGCYNTIEGYTNLLCPDLLAGSADSGTIITFNVPYCPPSDTDIATVTWYCDNAVVCAYDPSGPIHCGTGGSFTITIPAGHTMVSYRFYKSWIGCCNVTKSQPDYSNFACLPGGEF